MESRCLRPRNPLGSSHCLMGTLQAQFQTPSSSTCLTGGPRATTHFRRYTHMSSTRTVSLNIRTITHFWELSISFSTLNKENWAFFCSKAIQKSASREAVQKLTSKPFLWGRATIQFNESGLKPRVFWRSFLEKSSRDISSSVPSTSVNKKRTLWCLRTPARGADMLETPTAKLTAKTLKQLSIN